MTEKRKLTFSQAYALGFLHLFRALVVCMVVAGWVIVIVNILENVGEFGIGSALVLTSFGLVFSLVAAGLFWFASVMLREWRAAIRGD